MPLVNDIHSQLNPTLVAELAQPGSVDEVVSLVRRAAEAGSALAIAGGRHAMGGQEFAAGGILLDTSRLDAVHRLDRERGLIEVGAGMQWPALVEWLWRQQDGSAAWGIVQKQTGADRLSIGGAVSANVHGRGLALRPFVQDVEAVTLVDATGTVRRVSRQHDSQLFRLVVGGYGLFGVVTSVELRLTRRHKLRRLVTIERTIDVMERFQQRIAEGCTYGDFQFLTDEASPDFMARGVFSCYQPVPDDTPIAAEPRELGEAEWRELYRLAHVDRRSLYDAYAGFYLATDGQVYWSDRHQLSVYLDGYHAGVDQAMGAQVPGSEMISEVYVPRDALAAFLARVADDFRVHGTTLIYGTVRLVERDDETVLAWAREPWACIVFNLCVRHDAAGLVRAQAEFRRLIDRAMEYGGSYFLTYHRWATPEQAHACHPALGTFIAAKRERDPGEVFRSDWWAAIRRFPGGPAPSTRLG